MISIFTTKDNLESICLDNDKQPWLDMIIKLKEVFVDDDNIFAEDADPDDDPFYTLDGMQISINTTQKDFINNIPHNPVSVLSHPLGIYLLDISTDKAKTIQNDYGVICQSTSSLDYTPLTQSHFPTELVEGENKTWKAMLAQYRNLPSNSTLIIDAHIFDEDKFDEANNCYDPIRRVGLENVNEIINAILPKSFNDTYHIGVLITDIDRAKTLRRSRSNLTNARIASAINKLKKTLNRNYPINIEVVFFDPSDDGHKLIHNRRILSNYYIVTSEYKLAALKNGKSVCAQTIDAFPLFEDLDKTPNTDKKEKRVRNEIRLFSEFFDRQPQSHTALLYQNGQKTDDFKQLKHRFFS